MTNQAQMVAVLVLGELESRAQQESGVTSAKYLQRARTVHQFLANPQESLRCAQRSVEAAPNWVPGRLALGDAWLQAGNYDQALAEYRWCKARKPFDAAIRARIKSAETLRAQSPRDGMAKRDGVETAPSLGRIAAPVPLPPINRN